MNKLAESLVPALIHALYSIVYLLFVIPFDLWSKAVVRLAEQREKGSLRIASINSPWPFFSLIKTLLIEFLFDFFIFLSYFVGILMAIVVMFNDGGFLGFVATLVGAYYVPVGLSLARDFFQLLLLPFAKFLSWCRKPAQYMDLNVQKREIM